MSILLALAVCGCGLRRGNVDLLEARLRQQEDRLYELQSQLAQAHTELTTARRETDLLRDQLANRGTAALLPEQTTVLSRVEGLGIDPLLSGGLDRDEKPGDDLLAAMVTPRDADGNVLKLPGTLRLELFDLARPADKQRIGQWEFDPEQTRDHWHNGLLGSGYRFRLPWQQIPQHEALLLHARLTTADGRQFDASETLRINPPTPASLAMPHPPAEEQLVEPAADVEPADRIIPPKPIPTSDRWTEETRPVIR